MSHELRDRPVTDSRCLYNPPFQGSPVLARNVLIFHAGALGDFVITWPLALALARLYPQSRLFYVVAGQKGALSDRVLRLESSDADTGGWHHLFSDAPTLPEPAKRLLAGAHTVVSFVAGQGDTWANNVRAMAPNARLNCLSTVVPDDFAGHVTEYLIGQWSEWTAAQGAARQILQSVTTRGIPVGRSTPTAVVIHPGGGSAAKCWPLDRYVQVAERLRDAGRTVHVLLGEVELEKWPQDQIAKIRDAAEVRTPATYVDLLSELAEAAVFVGNDSGPGHLAAIVGTPVVSIFGPRDPKRWAPIGPKLQVVSGEFDAITPEQIVATIGPAAVL